MTGQLTYNIPGIYSFVCPPDVTSVSVVCVGGGGQGATCMGIDSNGGGGGGLGYKNNITVIPGNTYKVVVGDAGSKNFWGGDSTRCRNSRFRLTYKQSESPRILGALKRVKTTT